MSPKMLGCGQNYSEKIVVCHILLGYILYLLVLQNIASKTSSNTFEVIVLELRKWYLKGRQRKIPEILIVFDHKTKNQLFIFETFNEINPKPLICN